MSRILYVTCQPVHRPGLPATGGGLRAWAIGEALRGRGHEVVFAEVLGGAGSSPTVADIPALVSEAKPDIVLLGNWGLADRAAECPVPTVLDFNGSLVLENQYRRTGTLLADMLGKIRALGKVDLVLAGSSRQRMYLLAWCLMAGVTPDSIRIEVLPFSLPPSRPQPHPPEEPVLVMAGYRWPWLDGREAVEAASRGLETAGRGVLRIYSAEPPYFDALPGEDSRVDQRGALPAPDLPRVEQHAPLAFEELAGVISRATAGLDLWRESPERALSLSSRGVVYLWCGLPVITNRGAGLAEDITAYGAGWTIDPGDGEAVARVVRELVTRPEALEGPRAGAARLARERFCWDRTIGGLDSFCRSPARARGSSPLVKALDDLEAARSGLENTKIELEGMVSRLEEKARTLSREAALMGEVHRRPRGLEVAFSPRFLRARLRRPLVGVPALAYLMLLGQAGELLTFLHRQWGRR